eukprot:m.21170 g.21170  ORF g.21170 m.21170 type:complete len:1248 (-) comp3902_c0_seq1:2287-6030(-)
MRAGLARSMGPLLIAALCAILAAPAHAATTIAPVSNTQLTEWILDLSAGSLDLVFDGPVQGATFQPTLLTLQNDAGEELSLSADSRASAGVSSTIVVLLSAADLDAAQALAVGAGQVLLSGQRGFILDRNSEPVSLPTPLAAANIEDSTKPRITSFGLVSSPTAQAVLSLTFTEPVMLGLIDPTKLSLTNSSASDAPDGAVESMTLSAEASVELPAGDGANTAAQAIVDIALSDSDLELLRGFETLARSADTTFLTAEEGAAQDSFGNSNEALTKPLKASTLTVDVTPPTIAGAQIDLDEPTSVLIEFSEAVNSTVFDFASLVLASDPTGANSFAFAPNNATFQPPSSFFVRLAPERRSELLLTVNLTTVILVAESAVVDIAGNPSRANTFFDAANVVPDTTPPQVLTFGLDREAGIVNMTLSESITEASVDLSKFAIGGPSGAAAVKFANSSTVAIDGTSLTITLLEDTLLAISAAAGPIATSAETSFLVVEEGAFSDLVGNPTGAATIGPAASFVPDSTAPTLVEFGFLNNRELVMNFSEPVLVPRNASKFVIQNAPGAAAATQIRLSNDAGFSYTDAGNPLQLHYQLSTADRSALASGTNMDPPAAISADNTILRLEQGAVSDTSNVPVEASEGVPASEFGANFEVPVILAVAVDLGLNRVVATLSKDVVASSANWNRLSLQGQSLQGVTEVVANSSLVSEVAADLPLERALMLKYLVENGTALSYTAEADFVQDDNGIGSANATGLFTTVADVVRPTLRSFSLSFDTDTLRLVFDDIMNPASVDPTKFLLGDQRPARNSSRRALDFTPLTGGTVNASAPNVIDIVLTPVDAEFFESNPPFGRSPATTLLAAEEGAASDSNGNALAAITPENALAASSSSRSVNNDTLSDEEFWVWIAIIAGIALVLCCVLVLCCMLCARCCKGSSHDEETPPQVARDHPITPVPVDLDAAPVPAAPQATQRAAPPPPGPAPGPLVSTSAARASAPRPPGPAPAPGRMMDHTFHSEDVAHDAHVAPVMVGTSRRVSSNFEDYSYDGVGPMDPEAPAAGQSIPVGALRVAATGFSTSNPGELNVERGDELRVVAPQSNGWIAVTNSTGHTGLVPVYCVMSSDDDEAESLERLPPTSDRKPLRRTQSETVRAEAVEAMVLPSNEVEELDVLSAVTEECQYARAVRPHKKGWEADVSVGEGQWLQILDASKLPWCFVQLGDGQRGYVPASILSRCDQNDTVCPYHGGKDEVRTETSL